MKLSVSNEKALGRSFWALIASPFSFFIGFQLAELTSIGLGLDDGNPHPTILQTIVIVAVALVFMLPAPILSFKWALQAVKAGYRIGIAVAVLAGLNIAYLLIIFVFSAIVN